MVTEEQVGERLDRLVAAAIGQSRARIQALLKAGAGRVNERVCGASYRVRLGDAVTLVFPAPLPTTLQASDIPIDVVYEDEHVVVVDKPSGMVVHPAPGHPADTLVNVLLGRVSGLSGIGGVLRPGIVHRLDRYTSGLLVVAKRDDAHLSLSRQFASHTVERLYDAIAVHLQGPPLEDRGTFDTLHGRHPNDRKRFSSRVERGRRAVTHYEVVRRYSATACQVVCRLQTGRTHQIRVHFSDRGWPTLADRVYGGRAMQRCRLLDRQALHARVLGFAHPETSERLYFERQPPADFASAQARLSAGEDWR